MNLKKYQAIKAAAAETRSARDRAVGAHESALKRLQTEWGCGSLAEARAQLREREAKEAKLAARIEKNIAEFNQRWQHLAKEDIIRE